MDIGRTLSRAWEITWRYKILWILGFLAALGEGTGGLNSSYRFGSQDFQNGTLPNFNMPALASGLIVGFACLAFIIGIALFVISTMARGGLIAAAAQVEDDGNTTLGSAWAVGQRRFWTLFGIGVLMVLPILLIVLLAVIGIFMVAGGAILSGNRGENAAGPVIAGLFACICPLICVAVIAGIVLTVLRLFAERAAILEGLGWTAAVGRGWQVMRQNLGNTLILWIIFLVLGLIIGAIAAAISLPIVAPLAIFVGNNGLSNAALIPICGLGLIATLIAAIVGAILNTFTSATWTLAYRQMTNAGLTLPPPPPPAPLAE
jgi:hypothetical protein